MNNDDSDNQYFFSALRGLKQTINEAETNSIMADSYDHLRFNVLKADVEVGDITTNLEVASISSINPKLKGIESVLEFWKKLGISAKKNFKQCVKFTFSKRVHQAKSALAALRSIKILH